MLQLGAILATLHKLPFNRICISAANLCIEVIVQDALLYYCLTRGVRGGETIAVPCTPMLCDSITYFCIEILV
jgi:hypothetical protein